MRLSRLWCASLFVAVLSLGISAQAANLTASGTVLGDDGKPMEGVLVSLALAKISTTTDASGNWSLGTTPTTITSRAAQPVGSRRLILEDGRLYIRFDGHDLSGRSVARIAAPNPSFLGAGAARTASAPDTLLYSWKGKVRFRDTISASGTKSVRTLDTSVNSSIVHGYVTDVRDGQTYRTVKIGTQEWMAQNLNFKTDSSFCYNNDPLNCTKYGRLYSWAAAMNLDDSCNVKNCSTMTTAGHRGVCPAGWHVPSDAEWTKLTDTALPAKKAGGLLKAAVGWPTNGYTTDPYGFRLLPAGVQYGGRWFDEIEYTAVMWGNAETALSSLPYVWTRIVYDFDSATEVSRKFTPKSDMNSLRCSKDDAKYGTIAIVAAPTFTPTGGTSSSTQFVSLKTKTPGATIYYTTDGSTPTEKSAKFSEPISVSATKTIKAIAVKPEMVNSSVSSDLFSISSRTSAATIPWNTNITYGSVTDADGQTYRTVKIGTQEWMAENLNYSKRGTIGKCYENDADSCALYGRLYTWSEIMSGSSSSESSPSGVQGICPDGWHVPSHPEWVSMQTVVDATSLATGTKLKSQTAWPDGIPGTDNFGFRAFPIGWWTSTQIDSTHVNTWNVYAREVITYRVWNAKVTFLSLRCVKNSP